MEFTFVPQVFVWEKSAELVPLTTIEVMVSALLDVFVNDMA